MDTTSVEVFVTVIKRALSISAFTVPDEIVRVLSDLPAILPLTSKRWPGVFVPIPTLPPAAFNANGVLHDPCHSDCRYAKLLAVS